MSLPLHALVSGNIFVELGIASISDEEKAQLLDQMNELVLKRVMLRVIELISDEQAQAMSLLPSDDDRLNYVVKAVPNFGDIVQEEIGKVKNEMAAASLAG